MRIQLIAAMLFVLAASAAGQSTNPDNVRPSPSDPEARRAAEMKRLEFMHGTWKGTGWMMTREGRKVSAITETFRPKLGGRIAVVDGLGTTKDEKTGEERVIHQAFGVFSYDAGLDRLRFRYYKAETGAEDVTDISFVDGAIVWGFDVRETGSRIRFTMRVNEKGNWFEVGEFSRDGGKIWSKFLEMELSRVADKP